MPPGSFNPQVLAVTEAAAANDPAASLKRLDELVLKLDEAAARGDVSFKRHQSIRKSVDAVRADLNARQLMPKPPGLPLNRNRQRKRRPQPPRRLPRPPSLRPRRPTMARQTAKARATADVVE